MPRSRKRFPQSAPAQAPVTHGNATANTQTTYTETPAAGTQTSTPTLPPFATPAQVVAIGIGLDTARYGHHATFLDANLHDADNDLDLLFRLQEVQFFDIIQVEGSAGLFLQADQVLDADKRSPNAWRHLQEHCPLKSRTKIERRLNEQVDPHGGMLVAEDHENQDILITNPFFPFGRVGEILKRDRHNRPIGQPR